MAQGTYNNPIWVRRRRRGDDGTGALLILAVAVAPFVPIYVYVCKGFFVAVGWFIATTHFRNPGNENLAAIAPFLGYAACLVICIFLFLSLERVASGLTALYYFGFWAVVVVYGIYRLFFHVGDDPNLIFVAVDWISAEWASIPSGLG